MDQASGTTGQGLFYKHLRDDMRCTILINRQCIFRNVPLLLLLLQGYNSGWLSLRTKSME